ncbi:NYN domain-containing protein [Dictyobacter arantiisoli]|uniref:NYN domain-containing protein n=1 Tax=Dictyobacter arantiisoli TaxID=2014874 RepID=A0A5A5T5D4_9CHLR|nr:NYN domain-containing protein [Dictyobacter arantiisoli]GCF06517.1 hypothetical protein KDI_00810 [Dictyobacter arantiisoli]
MTTQHSHDEHNDVDASVVEITSAPENETTTTSAASETDSSVKDAVEAGASSSEDQTPPVKQQEATTSESPADADATPEQEETAEETTRSEVSTSDTESNITDVHAENAQEPDHSSASLFHTENDAIPSSSEAEQSASAHSDSESEPTANSEEPAHAEETIHTHSEPETSTEEVSTHAEQETEQSSVTPEEVPDTQEPVQASVEEEATTVSFAHVEEASSVDTDTSASVEATSEEAEPSTTQTNEAPVAENATIPADQTEDQDIQGAQNARPVQAELPEVSPAAENPTAQESLQEPEQNSIPATTFPYVEEAALIDTKAEEVRPFTDFIAEFRQAEAALHATLRDTQAEAFSLLSSVAANLASSENQEKPELIESTETSATEKNPGTNEPQKHQTRFGHARREAEQKEVQHEAESQEAKPAVRPVSPLLRPASRLRLPRHGIGRHVREDLIQAATEEATAPETNAEPVIEPTAEPTPRPARRYRFDRPATAATSDVNGSSSPTHHTPTVIRAAQTQTPSPTQKLEEKRLAASVNNRVEEAKQTPESSSNGTANAINQPVEVQSNKKQQNAPQEPEATPVATPVEHGRRRHNQKEQQNAAPTQETEASAPVVESVAATTKKDVPPEELPPLEYSELQKASSRRRRRHRSGTNSTVAHSVPATNSVNESPVVPPTPTPTPTPAPVPMAVQHPRTPVTAQDNDNQMYNIVSGYTVSQMNQGNDVTGPFMGPEPSPARGSVVMRDGRNTRAEARTTPTPALYSASRPAESGFSTAAINQFANVVAQALQTQTDRMVAEFRRANQAPTNVSVTLPPFPSTERVGVFVDVANLLYSARTLRMGVDFGKLLDFLRGNRRLVRAHAYCPTSPQVSDEQMFLQAVKGLGYRITTKNYKTFSSGAKKADLDLDLCMDVVRLVDGGAVDCVVLVSGDSDFMPMLDYCSDHGVRVEVAAFDEAMSATLRQSCDLFINLSMLEEIRA